MQLDLAYIDHWDEKFQAGQWGRYPPEELVRFMGRHFKKCERSMIKVLEIGCGPGANIWFLHREGYHTFGIDGSSTAIEQTRGRIEKENSDLNKTSVDLRVGNFSQLPWPNETFDVVVDVFSIYSNPPEIIDLTLKEVRRVLKSGGCLFFKVWGTECTGFGEGKEISPLTYSDIPSGPCANMGVSHFFNPEEITRRYSEFSEVTLDRILRTDKYSNSVIEEFVGIYKKGE